MNSSPTIIDFCDLGNDSSPAKCSSGNTKLFLRNEQRFHAITLVMAKRVLEESESVNIELVIQSDCPAEKKSREEKHAPESKGCQRFSKVVNGEEKVTKEQRKERKQLKKARKLDTGGNFVNESTVQPFDLGGTDVKNARRAKKAKRKATEQRGQQLSRHPTDDKLPSLVPRPETPIPYGSGLYYTENSILKSLDQVLIDKFITENFISISDPTSATQSLRPIISFSYLPATGHGHQAPFKNFKAPTPIQAAAWPFLFAGRDVIGIAETGSGKTMAFAVPCVHYITSLDKSFVGAKAVIVSPTRELAMQSYEQITELATLASLRTACVYGGVPKDEQRKALKNADIVVATPGRLNDLINDGSADLGKVGYVVLDEADGMLDKGFEEEVRKIINTTLPLGERQTLMFTATWPESVRTLAASFMKSPIKIAIGDNPSGDLRANARIVQKVEVVDPSNKECRLLQLLKQYQSGSQKDDRILVFCLYKKEATRIKSFIRSKGIRAAGIHGDLSQEQRTRSLDAFKKGSTPVLVATDVAARGLDIPAVKLVINCTFPLTVEDYVHRIGRTGRAGEDGLAITLFTEHDKGHSGA
jgi:ATP-dependent RNA helicase DBP3